MTFGLASTILSQLRGRPERRGAPRVLPTPLTPCRLTLPDASRATLGWIHNLSVLGAGVLLELPCPVGSVVSLYIANAGHTCDLALGFRVIRCQRVVTGDYYLGGEFTRVLSYEELLPFLA